MQAAVHRDGRLSFMTDPIADFYTRHPYPPPVENLDRARDEWRDPDRHRTEFHLFWPERPYRADLDILVAGCGTWQAARYAVTRPAARVVGIDVSATSIEHTRQLKQKYDLTNLELRQLSVEHAGELTREFDLIICTGVLHHLADPDAGLRALRSVLRADGAMYLMVYAPYGRAGIYMLQDYCRRLGIGTSDQEIRDLAATVDALPRHHPLSAALRSARDAHNTDALADALLNPRDRSFSVPQLVELLDRHGLIFHRWFWQAPYLPQCGAIAGTPHASRLAALPEREQYAAMELWRGTMTTHSVIVRRANEARALESGGFAGDGWIQSVPIRRPWTQLVHERVPQGAAAVVLNRSHAFPDLVLVLDADDKRLFDGIDGRRTIGDITAAAQAAPDRARTFFEKLWRYDQIVLAGLH